MTTDERLDALVFTVENMAGIMKDLLEAQTKRVEWEERMERQAEADRQIMQVAIAEMREGVAAMLVIGERLGTLIVGPTNHTTGHESTCGQA